MEIKPVLLMLLLNSTMAKLVQTAHTVFLILVQVHVRQAPQLSAVPALIAKNVQARNV